MACDLCYQVWIWGVIVKTNTEDTMLVKINIISE